MGDIRTVGFWHTGPEVKSGTRVSVAQAFNTLGGCARKGVKKE